MEASVLGLVGLGRRRNQRVGVGLGRGRPRMGKGMNELVSAEEKPIKFHLLGKGCNYHVLGLYHGPENSVSSPSTSCTM